MKPVMEAMLLDAPHAPLPRRAVPVPEAHGRDVLIKVLACGVCRTDLHIVDGELRARRFPLIPGHEIVGAVAARGPLCSRFVVGQRVGVPWLAGSCGACTYCAGMHENLCDDAIFTGLDRHGGYAEYALADERFCFHLPDCYDDIHVAPLLCAGLIGYRAYTMTGTGQRIGLYGFGAAAHIVAQLAIRQGREVYAFTRPGDTRSQQFARSLGASWAGGSDELAPQPLDAAILFAPAGPLVPLALAATRKGAVVVCAGIHMSDIPSFPYALLWGERIVRSVANLTRADGEAFFAQVAHGEVATTTVAFPLSQANAALRMLRSGEVDGAVVLVPPGSSAT